MKRSLPNCWLPAFAVFAGIVLVLVCAALGNAGCASVRLDGAKELMARPDFEAARKAAPEWTRAALKRINALEEQQEKR